MRYEDRKLHIKLGGDVFGLSHQNKHKVNSLKKKSQEKTDNHLAAYLQYFQFNNAFLSFITEMLIHRFRKDYLH